MERVSRGEVCQNNGILLLEWWGSVYLKQQEPTLTERGDMEAEEKLVELVDKNIERFTGKLNELGPGAEHLWASMVAYKMVSACVSAVAFVIITAILGYVFFVMFNRWKISNDRAAPDYTFPVAISGVIFFYLFCFV